MAVHFLDAREGQCKFPLWGEDKSIGDVCGAPARPGKPYCAECHARTHYSDTPRAPFVPRERAPRFVADDVTPELVEMIA